VQDDGAVGVERGTGNVAVRRDGQPTQNPNHRCLQSKTQPKDGTKPADDIYLGEDTGVEEVDAEAPPPEIKVRPPLPSPWRCAPLQDGTKPTTIATTTTTAHAAGEGHPPLHVRGREPHARPEGP